MKSIQIRNAKIIDGINEFSNISNLYIENGYIREISIKNKSADLIIDADGKKLVPGFVDAHIHIESTFATPLEFSNVFQQQNLIQTEQENLQQKIFQNM